MLHGKSALYLNGVKMYIRETLFFDTFVLVVKKQHNTRTVWSGIFFSLTFTVVMLYCIHSLKRKKFMKPTYTELLEVVYYLSNQIMISENQTKIEYFELPMKDAVRATVEFARAEVMSDNYESVF